MQRGFRLSIGAIAAILAAWIRTRKLEGSFGTAILQPDRSRPD